MHLIRCGSGDPILFIHGMPTSSRLWRQVIAHLCARFDCFAVDLPGMGATPRTAYDGDFLRRFAQELDAIRMANGIEKWHVVGHDAGAAIAVHYARFFPQTVDRMVLLAPALFPELKPFFLLEILRKPILGELLAPLVLLLFWKIAMRRALADADAGYQAVDDFRASFGGVFGAWKFMKVLRWGDPASVLAEVPQFLPTLAMETLVFHGRRDAAIPADFAARAVDLLPNAQLVTVDAGHFIPLDQADSVAGRLAEFFLAREQEASAQSTLALA